MAWVRATDNMDLDLDSLPHSYTYNGSNQVLTDTVTHQNGSQYVQTFTYSGGNLATESAWVKV